MVIAEDSASAWLGGVLEVLAARILPAVLVMSLPLPGEPDEDSSSGIGDEPPAVFPEAAAALARSCVDALPNPYPYSSSVLPVLTMLSDIFLEAEGADD